MSYETVTTNSTNVKFAGPIANTELSDAIGQLHEIAAEAGKACQEYLIAREQWYTLRGRMIDQWSKIGALRDQHDREVPLDAKSEQPGRWD